MSVKSGRLITLTSVIFVMTAVIFITETRHVHSSQSSSRSRSGRRGYWDLIDRRIHQRHHERLNKRGHRSLQTEITAGERSKRQTLEDGLESVDEVNIFDMANTSSCNYIIRIDSVAKRNPKLIVHVECANENKIPCGYHDSDYETHASKKYYCTQAYGYIDAHYYNNNTDVTVKVFMGCLCAPDNESNFLLKNQRKKT